MGVGHRPTLHRPLHALEPPRMAGSILMIGGGGEETQRSELNVSGLCIEHLAISLGGSASEVFFICLHLQDQGRARSPKRIQTDSSDVKGKSVYRQADVKVDFLKNFSLRVFILFHQFALFGGMAFDCPRNNKCRRISKK